MSELCLLESVSCIGKLSQQGAKNLSSTDPCFRLSFDDVLPNFCTLPGLWLVTRNPADSYVQYVLFFILGQSEIVWPLTSLGHMWVCHYFTTCDIDFLLLKEGGQWVYMSNLDLLLFLGFSWRSNWWTWTEIKENESLFVLPRYYLLHNGICKPECL